MFIFPFYDGLLPAKTATIKATALYYKSTLMPISGFKQCTVFFKLTSASSTKSVTIKATLYFNGIAGEQFTLDTVTATTSGVNSVKKLERDFSGDWDENASDIEIEFTKTTGIAVTIEGGINVN